MTTPPSSPKTERKVEESSQESLEQSSEQKVEQSSEQVQEPVTPAAQTEQQTTPPQNAQPRSLNTLFGFAPRAPLVARCEDHVHVLCPEGHIHTLSNEMYDSLLMSLNMRQKFQQLLVLAVIQSLMQEASLDDENEETLEQDSPSASNDETISQTGQSENEVEEENSSSCRMH